MWYNNNMKECTKCKENKELNRFSKDIRNKSGTNNWCKECIKESKEVWVNANPGKLKETKRNSDKQWYKNNKNKKIETNTKWKEANKEHTQKWFKEYKKNREINNPNYKIANNLRTRLWYAIKNKQKVGSAIDDLGCTIDELKVYLQEQFQEGMTWDNYGEWHIDHKIALISFNLEDREEFLKACNYSNLQPLWAIDNLKKGSK